MTAAEIAAACGNARREGRGWRCRCPVHGGHSLVLADGRNALLVKCWGGCDTSDVLAELRRLRLSGDDSHTGDTTSDRPGGCHDRESRIRIARRIWEGAKDARGTPVERYLRSRRITIPAPPSLRWAPGCRHPSGNFLPAMVAKIVNIDGELIGLHRTFLRPDGSGKADIEPQKAMLGRAAVGTVRLHEPRPGTPLVIAEGVESAMAAAELMGWPAWAALSAGGMERLILPPTAREIVIAVDRDRKGTGEAAARRAATRWVREGRPVRLVIPDRIGADANDLLREARYAA
jgi:putative DNA primase/helicase